VAEPYCVADLNPSTTREVLKDHVKGSAGLVIRFKHP
jgi:hypothetical protein